MKRFLVFFIVTILSVTVLCSCSNQDSKLPKSALTNENQNSDYSITADAKEVTLKDGSFELEFKITNNTDKEANYDLGDSIEKKIDGQWYTINKGSVKTIACVLKAKETNSYKITSGEYDGYTFDKGSYRLIKEIDGNTYAVDFSLI